MGKSQVDVKSQELPGKKRVAHEAKHTVVLSAYT